MSNCTLGKGRQRWDMSGDGQSLTRKQCSHHDVIRLVEKIGWLSRDRMSNPEHGRRSLREMSLGWWVH